MDYQSFSERYRRQGIQLIHSPKDIQLRDDGKSWDQVQRVLVPDIGDVSLYGNAATRGYIDYPQVIVIDNGMFQIIDRGLIEDKDFDIVNLAVISPYATDNIQASVLVPETGEMITTSLNFVGPELNSDSGRYFTNTDTSYWSNAEITKLQLAIQRDPTWAPLQKIQFLFQRKLRFDIRS